MVDVAIGLLVNRHLITEFFHSSKSMIRPYSQSGHLIYGRLVIRLLPCSAKRISVYFVMVLSLLPNQLMRMSECKHLTGGRAVLNPCLPEGRVGPKQK